MNDLTPEEQELQDMIGKMNSHPRFQHFYVSHRFGGCKNFDVDGNHLCIEGLTEDEQADLEYITEINIQERPNLDEKLAQEQEMCWEDWLEANKATVWEESFHYDAGVEAAFCKHGCGRYVPCHHCGDETDD